MKENICCPTSQDIDFCEKLTEVSRKNWRFSKQIKNSHLRIEVIVKWAKKNNLNFDKNSQIVMDNFIYDDVKNVKELVLQYLQHKALFDNAPCNIAIPCGSGKEYGPIHMLGERSRQILNPNTQDIEKPFT